MSEILFTLATTLPLWRVPVIAVLFVVIIVCFDFIFEALNDD